MFEKEFIVSNKQIRQSKAGKAFINLTLTCKNNTGEIYDGKIWAESLDRLRDKCNNGDIIRVVDGEQTVYNGRPQISLKDIIVISKNKWGLENNECLTLQQNLIDFIEKNVSNQSIKELTLKTFEKYTCNDAFLNAPAAVSHHHGYPGGLLQHTWELCQLALAIKDTDIYKNIKWDIVFAACLLHDLGKVHDYYIKDGLVLTTNTINLTGHLVTTPMEIFDTARQLGIDSKPDFNELLHAVVAHHGYNEFGSPKEPFTREAWLVHLVDMISSRLAINPD